MAFWSRKKKEKAAKGDVTPEELESFSAKDLSDEEFSDYINSAKRGSLDVDYPDEEDTTEDDAANDDSIEEPSEDEPDGSADESTDDTADSADDTEEEVTEPTENPEPYKSFANEDDYNSEISKAIDEARKNWELDNEVAFKRLKRMERISKDFYDSDDSFDKVADDLDDEIARRKGLSREELAAEREKDDLYSAHKKKEKAEADYTAEKDKIINQWVKDAGNLKVVHPDFSLEDALKNAQFADALANGKDVFSAYAEAYQNNPNAEPEPEAETPAENAEDTATTEEPTADTTETRKSVPQNGQSTATKGSGVKSNPSDMSDEDFDKYINSILKKR